MPLNDIPDVCIIGAGLAGGIMAYELASKGVRVTVLEAGPRHDPQARFSYMQNRLATGADPWASNLPERDVFTNAGEVEYPLKSARVKAVGGSTLHWGGLSLRLHETDFKMKSLYGLADDWPIGYEQLEPYYGKAEAALGVAGIADNPFASYRSTKFPLPPFPFNYHDRVFKKACDKLGIVMHHIPWARNSMPYQNAPACQAFSTCGSHGICPISAQYTSERHIQLAEKTGNAQVIPNANVLRIHVDKSGRAQSVTYATPDREQHELRAGAFVLAAHAIESTRLLLLSKSSRFPQGLANRSGLVGKNFMEHLYLSVTAKLKERVAPHRIGFNTAESHQFVAAKNKDDTGSVKIEFEITGPTPLDIARRSGNWGADLAREIRESYGRDVRISLEIEQLPDEKNTISLDPKVTDYFGNPAPRITYAIGDYEKATAQKAIEIGESIFGALEGAEITRGGSESMNNIGFGYHHMGTCRMGHDPEKSVVDSDLRSHDVDNLFIVGSGVFVTGGGVQPSLTIATLAIRAAEYLAKEFN
ncbi:MAG: NAD(P)-binding protein [Deltaproteobacteria bacterium]|nr:NAD(P)-binding protein [Deltaproteobacteria bacterium]